MENRFFPPNERLGVRRLTDLDVMALSVLKA
jgi:hypothetical protein